MHVRFQAPASTPGCLLPLKMVGDHDLVTVQKSLLDSPRQHCEYRSYFDEQLQGSSDRRAVIPAGRRPPRPSKKRKTLHELGPQEGSQASYSSQQSETQLLPEPPHWPKSQLSSQLSQRPGSQFLSQSLNTPHGGKPKRARAQKKNAAVGWFLQNAPTATEWRRRQIELELDTVEQYEQVIRAFTDRAYVTVEREPYQGDGHSKHELIDLAERLVVLTRDPPTNAKLQRSFASFQLLILLSYCEILRIWDIPYVMIDPIIQDVAGRESDRRRLLNSASWINGLIVDLVSHGWSIYRATELFFIGVSSELSTSDLNSHLSHRRAIYYIPYLSPR